MFRIEILRGDEAVHNQPIGVHPIRIGRAHGNDLVLGHARVSGSHLQIWLEAGELWVEDLGSRNGTTLDGRTLTGKASAVSGAVMVLGDAVHLRLAGQPSAHQSLLPALSIVDERTGIKRAILSDRLTLGSSPDCGIVLADGPLRAGTLLIHPDQVWLGTDTGTHELQVGQRFELQGQHFLLKARTGNATRTESLQQSSYDYRLDVDLHGPRGAIARLHDSRTGAQHQVNADIRATLLYVLAKQVLDDRALGTSAQECGWVADEAAARGIWGRKRLEHGTNNVNVVVHRLRKEVASSGFDPWFLEKKRLHLRVRLDDVQVR